MHHYRLSPSSFTALPVFVLASLAAGNAFASKMECSGIALAIVGKAYRLDCKDKQNVQHVGYVKTTGIAFGFTLEDSTLICTAKNPRGIYYGGRVGAAALLGLNGGAFVGKNGACVLCSKDFGIGCDASVGWLALAKPGTMTMKGPWQPEFLPGAFEP